MKKISSVVDNLIDKSKKLKFSRKVKSPKSNPDSKVMNIKLLSKTKTIGENIISKLKIIKFTKKGIIIGSIIGSVIGIGAITGIAVGVTGGGANFISNRSKCICHI